jgi:UDP-3-O-[3-hydroxymyristoyl] glucosamine N-acyltransferase
MLDRTKAGDTIGTMGLVGKSLVIRNLTILASLYRLSKIRIPENYPQTYNQIRESFPSIEIESSPEARYNQAVSLAKVGYGALSYITTALTNKTSRNSNGVICPKNPLVLSEQMENGTALQLQLPLNSVLWFSKAGKVKLYADLIMYPWDFLNYSQKILHEEVKENKISETASIAKSSIIEGPCIIEDGVIIDDFCKVKGPTYIGKGSYIGMGSLVRNCILCQDTKIGFHSEIGKSYFAGHDKISHQNVILDSIIGENVWFGGYSGTANVQLNRQNVKYRIGDTLVNTGTDHFGAVVGNNCAIGASVIILPGRHVTANSVIQAGTLLGKC